MTGTATTEIVASVEAGVRTGALPPGAALPTVRALAAELGVSAATVAKAYGELRRRGVVSTAGRGGTRVRPRPPVDARAARSLALPEGVLDLASGAPDAGLLPDHGAALARVAAASAVPGGYRDAGVLPALRALASERLAADGVPVPALAATAGALDAIDRLLSAHLRPGDRVAVEDPGWANLLDLVAALGLEPVAVPVDEDGPSVEGLRRALGRGARAVVVTARAHNPTGAAVGAARSRALRAELARHPDVLLVEDDHAAELSPVPLHTLAGATSSWAFVRSVSKPYGPDLRLAVLAGDEATVARVVGRMRLGAGWVSTLLQRLVVELWTDDQVRAEVAAAREAYAARRSALVAALARHGVAATGRTGVNVWVPVRDETRAVAALRDRGIAVAPGSLFRLASAPGIRVTVGPLAADDVEVLAATIADSLAAPGRAVLT